MVRKKRIDGGTRVNWKETLNWENATFALEICKHQTCYHSYLIISAYNVELNETLDQNVDFSIMIYASICITLGGAKRIILIFGKDLTNNSKRSKRNFEI